MNKNNKIIVGFGLLFGFFCMHASQSKSLVDDSEGIGIHELLTNYLASKDLDNATPTDELISLSVYDVVRFKSRETRGFLGNSDYRDTQYVPLVKYEAGAASYLNTITFMHNGFMTTYTFIHMTKPGIIAITISESKRDQKSGAYTVNPNMTKVYKFQVKE